MVKYNNNTTDLYDQLMKLQFDYDSVTSFNMYTASNNGQPTVLPKYSSGLRMGQFDKLRWSFRS